MKTKCTHYAGVCDHLVCPRTQHVEQNRDNIEKEAIEYAKEYGVSLDIARRDVTDEYIQGWYEAADDARYI